MKKYTVTRDEFMFESIVEIDEEKALPVIKGMVEFWSDWESRLEFNDGDYIKTFLQQLGQQIFMEMISGNSNLYFVDQRFRDAEGWVPMDGTSGITILSVDINKAEIDEFEIEEIQ